MAKGSVGGGKSGGAQGGGKGGNGGGGGKSSGNGNGNGNGWAGRTSTTGQVSGGGRSPAPGVPGHGKAP